MVAGTGEIWGLKRELRRTQLSNLPCFVRPDCRRVRVPLEGGGSQGAYYGISPKNNARGTRFFAKCTFHNKKISLELLVIMPKSGSYRVGLIIDTHLVTCLKRFLLLMCFNTQQDKRKQRIESRNICAVFDDKEGVVDVIPTTFVSLLSNYCTYNISDADESAPITAGSPLLFSFFSI